MPKSVIDIVGNEGVCKKEGSSPQDSYNLLEEIRHIPMKSSQCQQMDGYHILINNMRMLSSVYYLHKSQSLNPNR